jgi:hypothetical protein
MIMSVVVVVLLAAGDASDVAARTMVSTAESALEPGSVLLVRETVEKPEEEAALSFRNTLHADAIALVTWKDSDHIIAQIRLAVRGRSRWWARELVFRPADAPAERGRAIGFALATMIPEVPPLETPAAQEAPAPRPEKAGPIAQGPRGELGALGVMSAGIGATAAGLGLAIDGRWRCAGSVWLLAAGSWRIGRASEADASSRVIKIDAGVGWHAVRAGPVELGPRLDAGLVHHHLSRPIVSGGDSTDGRWLPVATLALEARWILTPALVLSGGIGVETAFGATRILLDDRQVATIPPVRTIGEVGVGLRF